MKFKLFVMASFLTLALSCSKEDPGLDCPDTLEELIVGSFEIENPLASGTVTFNSDGTWSDPDQVLLHAKINEEWLDEKTYTVLSETALELQVAKGSSSQKAEYKVESSTCSEIVVSYFGIELTMTRN